MTFQELEEIHNKMETELGLQGAYLDAIYYCPHHPHKGYEGEVPELKIECDCRKPKPGMLLKAADDYNIDLSQGKMSVKVLKTNDTWYGMTYHEDVAAVKDSLRNWKRRSRSILQYVSTKSTNWLPAKRQNPSSFPAVPD